MVTAGSDGSFISTVVMIAGSTSTYNVLVPANNATTGTLYHIKFKITSNQLILVKKANWHILKITAIKY